MLIIYGAFRLGGIETFFLRLAKERLSSNLSTKFFFLSVRGKSDEKYLNQLEQVASVFFLDDILPNNLKFLAFFRAPFSLIYPFSTDKLKAMLDGVSSMHTSDAHCAYVGNRIAKKIHKRLPITVGVYHEKQFTWGACEILPYFERKNRDFFYNALPKNNILTFNSNIIKGFLSSGYNIQGANYFPLGIDLPNREPFSSKRKVVDVLSIVSVGRLTDFKTYNCWMLDVVNQLKQGGIDVEYTIYGEGPLQNIMLEKVYQLNLQNNVFLKGNLNYEEFHTISQFDVFIGSGTALLEASSLGIPCIVGIESIKEAVSYEYFSELPGTSYNEDGLFKKWKVTDLLSRLHSLSAYDYAMLSDRHIEKSNLFSIKQCSENFHIVSSSSINFEIKQSMLKRFLYSISYAFELLYMRINPNSAFSKKYTDK